MCDVPIVEDHSISTGEIDAQTTTACGENEAEELWVGVKSIHELLSSIDSCTEK